MTGQKLVTPIGTFDLVEWSGRDTSGIQPFGDRVLILPDQASSQINGIYVPPDTIAHVAEAAETGVLVAVGEGAWAWNSDRSRRYEGEKPGVGSRVYFERYAGARFKGRDGLLYRLMDDKAIGGLAIEPEGEPVEDVVAARARSESQKLQDVIVRGHALDGELPAEPEYQHVELAADVANGDFEPKYRTGADTLEAPAEPRFPLYLTRAGVLIMAFSAADMEAKGMGQRWYATSEEAKRAYAESNEAHVDELVKAIKAS